MALSVSPRREVALFLTASLAASLLTTALASADHACVAEVASACPDRPGPEVAACLKDESEHEKPTAISSDCTDFVALNVACADTIGKICEDAFFSRDTVLCLTEWADQESIGSKCASVMKWAIPKKADEDGGPTDELGLSEKDYAEKKAWQAARKKGRTAAIEKMKDTDDTEEMERLKVENPQEYKQRLQEQEDRKKDQQAEMKRERLLQAALDRKQEDEDRKAGELLNEQQDDMSKDADVFEAKKPRRRVLKPTPTKGTWLPYILGGLFVSFVFFNILNFVNRGKEE